MQTKGLIPFEYEIFHPMACLHFLGIPSKLSSYEAFRDEEITTGHNSEGRGLRSSFGGSSFASSSLSSSVNKGRISSFFLQGQKATHKSEGSFNFSGSSSKSSINSVYSCCFSHYSSTMVSIKHTSSMSCSPGEHAFC